MDKKPISKQGFENIIAELKDLKEVQRPDILKTVLWARSLGDLSENADYSAAREKQRQIDKRIQYLEDLVNNAAVIDIDSLSGDRVIFWRARCVRRRRWKSYAVPNFVGYRIGRKTGYIMHFAGGTCTYWAVRWGYLRCAVAVW